MRHASAMMLKMTGLFANQRAQIETKILLGRLKLELTAIDSNFESMASRGNA